MATKLQVIEVYWWDGDESKGERSHWRARFAHDKSRVRTAGFTRRDAISAVSAWQRNLWSEEGIATERKVRCKGSKRWSKGHDSRATWPRGADPKRSKG